MELERKKEKAGWKEIRKVGCSVAVGTSQLLILCSNLLQRLLLSMFSSMLSVVAEAGKIKMM